MSAASDVISDRMAAHYRRELRTGKSRQGAGDRDLTPEERAVRIAALRRWGGGLKARFQRDLKAELEGFEKGLEELKKQAADHHEAAMAQSSRHHDEALEQLAGVHAKLDELSGSGGAFLQSLDSGAPMPRPAGQTDAERLRLLRALKRTADNEIPELVHAEKLRKLGEARDVALDRHRVTLETTTLAEAVVNEGLDAMPAGEAARVLKEYEEHTRALIKDEKRKIQARAKEEARAARAKGKASAKGKAKGKARAGGCQ
jgi:hypothetical protein